MSNEETQAANSATESQPVQPTDFRERMRLKLQSERTGAEPPGPPQGYEEPTEAEAQSDNAGESTEEALNPARHAEDDGEPAERDDAPTDDADAEEAVTDDSDDAAGEAPEGEIAELQERVKQAEERARLMERDYRIKTHKIAAAVRDIEEKGSVLRQQSAFFANLAEQQVQQFGQVNWDQLRTEPQQYQQTKAAYEAAIAQRDQLRGAMTQIEQQHKQLVDEAKNREAEVSREILSASPWWTPDMYAKLRDFAKDELGYKPEEFNDITDWRRIRDIHAQYEIAQAPKAVAKLPRKKGSHPASSQREQQVASQRNARGQFSTSRERLRENPGDRQARRQFFQDKLRAEREVRR